MARGLEPAGVTFVAEGIDGFVRDLGKADKAQDELVKSTKELDWTYRDASGRLRDLSGKFVTTGDSAEKTGKQTKKAGEQAERAGPSFSMLGSIVTGVAMAMTTMAIQAVAKLSQALVGLVQDSIGVATEFESSMAVLKISASGVEEELADLGLGMEDLSEAALAVGGDTRLLGVSASGAAESMTGLFKAGLTSQEVFGDLQGYLAGTADLGGTLRASIDLAAATTLDMVVASDVAAIALATFGSEAEEAGISTDEWINEAMNNLVQAADASVAEVEGLVEALKMVGPQASAMSIPLRDVNNALAVLSTRGIQGSSAGTGLNRMLLDLVKGTSDSAEMLETLGIVIYDNEGAMLPLVEIIGQFEVALGDATDAERDAAMGAIFTAQGARTMNTLLVEGVQGWVDMADATADAATMQEQAAAKGATLAAQQEALEGVIETLQIKIGSALLPALTNLTTMFSGLIDKYGPLLSEMFEKLGRFLEDTTMYIGGMINAFIEGDFEGILESFSFILIDAFGPEASKLITDFIAAFEPLYNAIVMALGGDATALMEGFSFTLANLFGADVSDAIFRTVDAIIEVIDKIQQWFVTNGPAIESSLDQIGQVFQAVFGSIWEVVQETVIPAFEDIWVSVQEMWTEVKKILEIFGVEFDEEGSGIEAVTGIIIFAIETLGAVISGVLVAATSVIKFFAETFAGVATDIREYIQAWKEQIQGFKDIFTGILEGDWQKVMKGFSKVFTNAGVMFRKTVKLMVIYITKPFEGLYKLIGGFVKGVIKFFKNLKKKLVGGSIIPDMMSKIEKVIETVLGAIEKVWNTVFKAIAELVKTVFATIERIIDRVMSAIEKIISTICKAIGGNWEDFVDLLHELWEETWEDIRDFVDTVFSAIEKFIDTISGNIQKAWETFTEAVQEAWEAIWEAIERFVDTTFSAIEKLIDTISGNIQKAWETFTEAVQEVWETVWGAIETFVDTTFSDIKTLIDTISGNIQKAWETFTGDVQEAWETVWGAIETFVDTTFGNIETFIGTVSGNIETAWNTFTGNVLSVWEGIWDDIDTKIRDIWAAIETFIGTISGNIETAWNTFTGNILSAWTGIWEDIDEAIRTIWGGIGGIEEYISGGIENIVKFFTDAAQDMIDAGAGIVDNIRQGIEDTWQSILDYVSYGLTGESGSIISQIIGALATIKEKAKEIVTAIRNGITEVWNRITSRITAMLEGTGGYAGIMSAITAAWTAIKNAGMQIINYIRDGLSDYFYRITTKLKDKLNDAEDGIIKGVTSAITKVTAAGAKIIDYIKNGLATAFYLLTNNLSEKLRGLKDSISTWTWGKIKEIGGRILDRIMRGVKAGTTWAANFWNWLWGEILDWLSWHSGEEVGEMMGDKITDGMVDSIRAQAGTRLLDALDYATGEALRGVGFQVPVQLSAAMQGGIEADVMRAAAGFSASLGMVAPAMMAPMAVSNSTEVNIGPVAINNGMDMAEFEVRVRQAVSEAI